MMRRAFGRYGFAAAYLACFLAAQVGYARLSPDAQARLVAWASTDVANLEHEPAGPLVLSAFVAPGNALVWLVLIALALSGANRALGNAWTALVCLAGHVVGSLVSEGIVGYRLDAGQLPAADRYITDVGPSYVVASAIVIAVLCGTRLARAAAVLDFAVLVFAGHIFAGLSQLDVAAVGHLTAMLTAAVATALIVTRRSGPRASAGPLGGRRASAGPLGGPRASAGHVADGRADQVGDRGGGGAKQQLP